MVGRGCDRRKWRSGGLGGVWPRRDAIMERFMSALGNDVDAPPQTGEVG
jgi:hypothetical protein